MGAFSKTDDKGLVTGISNWAKYEAFAREHKIFGDINPLWEFPFNDLYQQCRDDILHQIDLGMMPHLQNALISRFICELHKPSFCVQVGPLQDKLV
jgi:hypothetical protein